MWVLVGCRLLESTCVFRTVYVVSGWLVCSLHLGVTLRVMVDWDGAGCLVSCTSAMVLRCLQLACCTTCFSMYYNEALCRVLCVR